MKKSTSSKATYNSNTTPASLTVGGLAGLLPGGQVALSVTAVSQSITSILNALKEQPLSPSEKMKLIKQQAECMKEFAIARRIETAEKVIIEEFYDIKGSGKINAKVDAAKESASAGLDTSGQHVTRRQYTFEGVREQTEEEKAQTASFITQIQDIISQTPDPDS